MRKPGMSKFSLAVACTLLAIVTSNVAFADSPPIRIGVSTALTGNSAPTGTDIKNALEFANKEIGGGRYDLLIENDTCSGMGAATVAQKFTQVDRVPIVLGFACSSTVLASAPIYEKAEVVTISSSAASSDISRLGRFVFRTWPSDSAAITVLLDEMTSKFTALAVLSEQTEYCERLHRDFVPLAEEKGLEIHSESFLPNETDLRSLLLRIRATGVKAIFLNTQSERSFLAAVRQIREMGMEMQIYGLYWPGSAAFLREAGELAEGIIFVDAPTDEGFTAEGEELISKFTEQYGPPNYTPFFIATSIESFRVMDKALQSGEDISEYLLSTTFHGLFGEYSFDQNGDILGVPMMLKEIRNGNPVDL